MTCAVDPSEQPTRDGRIVDIEAIEPEQPLCHVDTFMCKLAWRYTLRTLASGAVTKLY